MVGIDLPASRFLPPHLPSPPIYTHDLVRRSEMGWQLWYGRFRRLKVGYFRLFFDEWDRSSLVSLDEVPQHLIPNSILLHHRLTMGIFGQVLHIVPTNHPHYPNPQRPEWSYRGFELFVGTEHAPDDFVDQLESMILLEQLSHA